MVYKRLIAVGVATCILSLPSSSRATLLSDLILGGSITSGPLEFTDFHYEIDSGSLSPPQYVNVVPIVDADGNYGLRVQSGFFDLAGGDTAAGTLRYTATLTDTRMVIHDIHLLGNPAVVAGNDEVDVRELVFDAVPTVATPLGDLSVFNHGGTLQLIDWADLSSATRSVNVTTELSLSAGSRLATLSFVDETFSLMIPEPSSMMMMLCGLIGLVTGARRSN